MSRVHSIIRIRNMAKFREELDEIDLDLELHPEEIEETTICPDCGGSGEGLLCPPGTGRCRRCKGTGEVA